MIEKEIHFEIIEGEPIRDGLTRWDPVDIGEEIGREIRHLKEGSYMLLIVPDSLEISRVLHELENLRNPGSGEFWVDPESPWVLQPIGYRNRTGGK